MAGRIVTITGGFGSGKTTVFGGLLEVLPNFGLISSHTRRSKRNSDLPGEYIYYSSDQEFDEMRSENPTLWDSETRGYKYCTLTASVREVRYLPDGEIRGMILVPTVIEILQAEAGRMGIGVTSVYLLSPPEDIVRKRLWERAIKDWSKEIRGDLVRLTAETKMAVNEHGLLGNDATDNLITEVLKRHTKRFWNTRDNIETGIRESQGWDANALRNQDLYQGYLIRNDGPIEETVQKVIGIIQKPSSD